MSTLLLALAMSVSASPAPIQPREYKGSAILISSIRPGNPFAEKATSHEISALAASLKRLQFRVTILGWREASKSRILDAVRSSVIEGEPEFVHLSGPGRREMSEGRSRSYFVPIDGKSSDGKYIPANLIGEDDLTKAADAVLSSRLVYSIDCPCAEDFDLDLGGEDFVIANGPAIGGPQSASSYPLALAREFGRLNAGTSWSELLTRIRAVAPYLDMRITGAVGRPVFGFGADDRISPQLTMTVNPDGTLAIPIGAAAGVDRRSVFEITRLVSDPGARQVTQAKPREQLVGRFSPEWLDESSCGFNPLSVAGRIPMDLSLLRQPDAIALFEAARRTSTSFRPATQEDADAVYVRLASDLFGAGSSKSFALWSPAHGALTYADLSGSNPERAAREAMARAISRFPLPAVTYLARLVSSTKTFAPPSISVSAGLLATPFGLELKRSAERAGVLVNSPGLNGPPTLRFDFPRGYEDCLVTTDAINVYRGNGAFVERSEIASLNRHEMNGLAQRWIGQTGLIRGFPQWDAAAYIAPSQSEADLSIRLVRVHTSARIGVSEAMRRPYPIRNGYTLAPKGDAFAIQIRGVATGGKQVPRYLEVVRLSPDGDVTVFWHNARPVAFVDGKWHYLGWSDIIDRPSSAKNWLMCQLSVGSDEIYKVIASDRPIPEFDVPSPHVGAGNPIFKISHADGQTVVTQQESGWASATLLREADDGSGLSASGIRLSGRSWLLSIGTGHSIVTSPSKLPDALSRTIRLDLQAVDSVLQSNQAGGSFTSTRLIEEHATLAGLDLAIADLQAKVGLRDTLIFHLSCGCLANSGEMPRFVLADQMISLPDLVARLGTVWAENLVVILDSNNSGEAPNQVLRQGFLKTLGHRHILVLAVRGTESVEPDGDLSSTVADAMRDPSTDEDGDGFVSASELRAAVEARLSGPRARIHSRTFSIGDDFVVCRASRASGGEALAEPVEQASNLPDPVLASASLEDATQGPIDVSDPNADLKPTNCHVLLIGCNSYGKVDPTTNQVSPLTRPVTDVENLAKVLYNQYGCEGVIVKNPGAPGDPKTDGAGIRFLGRPDYERIPGSKEGLPGKPALIATLKAYFAAKSTQFSKGENDELIVYFAGHGSYKPVPGGQGGRGMLHLCDATELDADGFEYELFSLLSDLSDDRYRYPRILLILDSCFSASSVNAVVKKIDDTGTKNIFCLPSAYRSTPDESEFNARLIQYLSSPDTKHRLGVENDLQPELNNKYHLNLHGKTVITTLPEQEFVLERHSRQR